MFRAAAAILAVLSLAAAEAGTDKEKDKGKRPKLELRCAPRFAFSPVNVLFTAELKGGDDLEEYYCPEIEWDWDDGGKSVQESDCDPFEAGTKITRRFTEYHEYRVAGTYHVKVTLRRARDAFAQASVRVTVKPGLGDPTIQY
jgi:hypothetical protein